MEVRFDIKLGFLYLLEKKKHASIQAALRVKRRKKRMMAFRRRQSQQRVMLVLMMCTCVAQVYAPEREVWSRERSSEWWETVVNSAFELYDWVTNFRMSKATFTYLCDEIRDKITRTDTEMRKCISVEMRVALTFWFLATNADYHTISHLFGLSQASVCLIRREVCHAILKELIPKYIKVPFGSKLTSVLNGFAKRVFPHCGGAIDGTSPLRPHKIVQYDYYNRKGWHSVILQAMVDDHANFTNIHVGYPGRVHDACVLNNSELFTKGERGDLFERRQKVIQETRVPVLVIGDPAYPLRPWLMKPYINTGALSTSQRNFNYQLSKTRVIVEHAFGRLKGRWRCLRKKLSVAIEDVPEVVGACCVLHNLCQAHGEVFDEQWLDSDDADAEMQIDLLGASTQPCNDPDGNHIRSALTMYLNNSS